MKKIIPLLLLLTFCKKERAPTPVQDKLRAGLVNFFTAETDATRRVVGLWVVDRSSIAKVARNKGLLSPVAAGNQAEMQEKLDTVEMFIHVGANGTYRSMTLVRNKIGMAFGRLKSKSLGGNVQTYELTVKGQTEKSAEIKIEKTASGDRLTYTEDKETIVANRESRSKDELLNAYEQRILSGADALP